jgi:hypothetical protein
MISNGLRDLIKNKIEMGTNEMDIRNPSKMIRWGEELEIIVISDQKNMDFSI